MAKNKEIEAKRLLALALKRKEMIKRDACFNPDDLASRPTKVQGAAMSDIRKYSERYVIGGNQSGKTNLGARECSLVFENKHPNFPNPDNMPLTLIVVGQTHSIITNELYDNKIARFLTPGTFTAKYDGNYINKLNHTENGNKILFFSHKIPEECRKSVQAFVADWVWLDEMPSSYKLLTELHTRCQSKGAPFLATFTPLLRNQEIRNHVDNGNPKYIKKYFLKTYENPLYSDDQLALMKSKHALMSEAERATRTEGAWYSGDNAVYDFTESHHVETPDGYHASWRHLETVDPAAKTAGYALLAEDPTTNVWYVIKAEYIKDKAPSELLDAVKRHTGEVNVAKRVADSHEAWYIKEAALSKVWYEIPHKKTSRKNELIKGLQQAISDGKLKVAPWCKLAIDEFISCQWAESRDRIVGSQHYHVLDCLQYAVDVLPEPEKVVPNKTFYQHLAAADKARRIREAEQKAKPAYSYARIMPKRRNRWR